MLWPKERPGKPPRGACLKGPPAKSQAQAQEDSGRFSPDQRPPPARVSAGASLPQAPTPTPVMSTDRSLWKDCLQAFD